MKKSRVLLLGKNQSIKDDFFNHCSDMFEIQTCSLRKEDIASHVKYFKPEVFVCCLYKETKESANVIKPFISENIPLVLVGDPYDCEEFNNFLFFVATLVLEKPISIRAIQEEIMDLINRCEKEMAETMRIIKEKEAKEQEASRRRHVLVIDDDSNVLRLLKEYLHDKYDVATALNGRVAMKFLENKSTDLIILDYEMPDEDGPEVMAKIRGMEKYANVPIVFLTGITEREKIAKALVMKPQGYLLKPINRKKVFATIDKILFPDAAQEE